MAHNGSSHKRSQNKETTTLERPKWHEINRDNDCALKNKWEDNVLGVLEAQASLDRITSNKQ